MRIYGDGSRPAALFEESNLGPKQLSEIHLTWDADTAQVKLSRVGNKAAGPSYSVTKWTNIQGWKLSTTISRLIRVRMALAQRD